jgi:hypothetical protein
MGSLAQRVAYTYLKIAEEKSLNLKIDEKFKTWKGKSPVTENEVGYWTVKGWLQIKKPNKNQTGLKEYAEEVFEKFREAIEEDEESESDSSSHGSFKGEKKAPGLDGKSQKILEDAQEALGKENFGLPKNVFEKNKFVLTSASKVERKEVEKFAKDIRDTFKTPGYSRGAIKQNLDVLGKDEWLKRHLSMVAKPIQAAIATMGPKGDLKKEMGEILESNPEVAGAAKNLASNWTQSTVIPMVTGTTSLAGLAGKAVTGAIGKTVLATIPVLGSPITVATIASAVVGTIAYKTLFHGRSKKAKGKLFSVSSDLPDSYDSLTSDVYAGYATPESVEAEYNKKLDEVLEDQTLGAEGLREKVLKLHKEFEDNARPAIDKALYQLGKTEGSGMFSFLKRGVEEKKGAPVLIKLLKLKDQFDAQDQIADYIENNSEEVGELIKRVLQGDEEIPPEVMDALKGKCDTESSSVEEAPSKKDRKASKMDRAFEKSIKEFKDLEKFLPVRKIIPLVENQIRDFIKRCNSLDPIEDVEVFKKAVTREHYQKRINFLKNWLLEQGYSYDVRRKKVTPLSREESKRRVLRVACFRLFRSKS